MSGYSFTITGSSNATKLIVSSEKGTIQDGDGSGDPERVDRLEDSLATQRARVDDVNTNLSTLTNGTPSAVTDLIVGNVKISGNNVSNYNGFSVNAKDFAPITQSNIVSVTERGSGLAYNSFSFADMSGTISGIGTYTYFFADVRARVKKTDPQAFQIPDLVHAYEENNDGYVYYNFDLAILYPTTANKFSGNIVYHAPNRSTINIFNQFFNDGGANFYDNTNPSVNGTDASFSQGTGTTTPGLGAGNGFIYRRGDMIIESGWDGMRNQIFSSTAMQRDPSNATITSTSKNPGTALSTRLTTSVSAAPSVGYGMTLPVCLYNNKDIISGEITTECLFGTLPYTVSGGGVKIPSFSRDNTTQVAIGSTDPGINTINTFTISYPRITHSWSQLTIDAFTNTDPDPIIVDPKYWYFSDGSGVRDPTLVLPILIPVASSTIGSSAQNPLNQSFGYVTVDRAGILADGRYTAALQKFDISAGSALGDGGFSDGGSIYAFTYMAYNPVPNQLGLLAVRDLLTMIRYKPTEPLYTIAGSGTSNSLSTYLNTSTRTSISSVIINGYSQVGRTLHDLIYYGYNIAPILDANGKNKIVADGYQGYVGGGGYNIYNRFALQTISNLQHSQVNTSNVGDFPSSYKTLFDPLGQTLDGFFKKYEDSAKYTNCIPKVIECNCSHEFFYAKASALVLTPTGLPSLPDPSYVRLYFLPGSNHGMAGASIYLANSATTGAVYFNPLQTSTTPWSKNTVWPASGAQTTYIHRANYINLLYWIKGIQNPPASIFPSAGKIMGTLNNQYVDRSDATLTEIKPYPKQMGWLDLSNVFDPSLNVKYGLVWNGNQYNRAIVSNNSPFTNQKAPKTGIPLTFYTQMLPKTDPSCNNYLGGVPMIDTAVPLFTVAGYDVFRNGFGADDITATTSACFKLFKNPAEKALKCPADPRKTISELYDSSSTYLNKVTTAIDNLVSTNFMLPTSYWSKDKADQLARAKNTAGYGKVNGFWS